MLNTKQRLARRLVVGANAARTSYFEIKAERLNLIRWVSDPLLHAKRASFPGVSEMWSVVADRICWLVILS